VNQPLFSILTASHNQLPFIGQCIRSIISQSYPHWELIVIDDMSRDGTYERASDFAKFDNIKVFRNKRQLYCGMTYNKLLSLASGEFCGIVDGDDILEPDAIATVVMYYLANPNIDFIWTKHKWGNTKLEKFRSGLSRSARYGTIYHSEEGLSHVYSHWRTFRTNMREKGVLFRDLKCTVDKDLGYNLELLGPGGFLNLELYKYRYHQKNMSHNSSQKAMWRKVRKYHKSGKNRYPSIKLQILKR